MELIDQDFNIRVTNRDTWLKIKRNDPSLARLLVRNFHNDPFLVSNEHLHSPTQIKKLRRTLISPTEIEELGRDIGNNTHLRELRLDGRAENDVRIWKTQKFKWLCEGEGINNNRSIKRLYLYGWESGNMIQFLRSFLENNTDLQIIMVNDHTLNHEEMRLLATPLTRRGRPLDQLDLRCNYIRDNSVEGLMMAFCESPGLTPKKLNLSDNYIGQNGCESIAHLLHDPRCTMEVLDLSTNRINDNSAIILASALVNNETLKKLILHNFTATGFSAFSQVLCNTTTINATFNSNHSLQDLYNSNGPSPLNDELRQYLVMNRNYDKRTVARRKVLMHHFSGDINMQSFEEMAPNLLVGVINFIDNWGWSNHREYVAARHTIIFYLLTNNLPLLCNADISNLSNADTSNISRTENHEIQHDCLGILGSFLQGLFGRHGC